MSFMHNLMKIRWMIYCLLSWSVSLTGQDWLRNGDLEDNNVCTEYQATCAPEFWYHLPMGVEAGVWKPPPPHSGENVEQVCWENFINPLGSRIYVVTPTMCPLIAGETYTLSLYLYNNCETPFSLGVRAMRSWPSIYYDSLLTDQPDILMTKADQLSIDKNGWRELRASFVAKGGEEFLVFGNFKLLPQKRAPKDRNPRHNISYLLDDIRLTAPDPPECPELELRRAYFYNFDIRHTDLDSSMLAAMKEGTTLRPSPPPPPVIEPVEEIVEDPSPASLPEFVISDIGFESGSYQLTEAAEPFMQACAAQIREQHPIGVRITGYTDDRGSEEFNRELSEKRAAAVRQWLTGHYALDAALFEVLGMGESAPVAPNDTEEGRRANRRVEIKFLYR